MNVLHRGCSLLADPTVRATAFSWQLALVGALVTLWLVATRVAPAESGTYFVLVNLGALAAPVDPRAMLASWWVATLFLVAAYFVLVPFHSVSEGCDAMLPVQRMRALQATRTRSPSPMPCA